MQKEGVNIGDFQIKLLQKIEELTLYSIEQNKLNKEQSELLHQQIQINKILETAPQNLENNNQKLIIMKNSIYILFTFAVSLNAQTFQKKDFSVGISMNNPIKAVDILFGNSFYQWLDRKLILQAHISIKIVLGLSKTIPNRSQSSNFIWYPRHPEL